MPDVALNGLLLDRPHSGTATYTSSLVSLLPAVDNSFRYELFVREAKFDAPGVMVRRVRTPLDAVPGTVGAQLDKLSWEEIAWPLASRGADIMHSLYFSAPVLYTGKLVVTVHDLIPLVLPGYFRSRQSAFYTAVMARSTRRADAVITVSQHSKDDIVRLLRIPESRVHVTYEAVDGRFRPEGTAAELDALRDRYGLPERFVLYLGAAERRKGLDTLVEAWARLAGHWEVDGVGLVIVARFPPPDALYPDIPRLAAERGVSIHFISQVDERDKPALYRAATAFVFPSRYEGFGLPPLEAMASGIPVISSNTSSLPEIVGDAALQVDPNDVAGWADAIAQVLGDAQLRDRLVQQGLKRAGKFSWERTARETVDVYRHVLQ